MNFTMKAMRRIPTLAVVIGAALLFAATPAAAHEDGTTSDPPSGTEVGDPFTDVTINFAVPVNDGVELALFGPGDDELVEDTTTTKLSDTSFKIEFTAIEQDGNYIVRYLATATVDQDFVVGAVQFQYGSGGGNADSTPWLLFAGLMIVVLAIGTAWSYRLHRAQTRSEVDENLSNTGV